MSTELELLELVEKTTHPNIIPWPEKEVGNKGVFRFNHFGKYAEAFNQVGIGRMVVYSPAYPSKSCHHQIYQYHSCGVEDKMILMRCTKTEAEIPEIICCSSPHFGKYVLGEGSINFSFSFQFCTVPHILWRMQYIFS